MNDKRDRTAGRMKTKWGKRAYVELYAGAADSRIRGTQKIILGSPLQAVAVEHPFDKYISCEAISENLEALTIRVIRHFPAANVAYALGSSTWRDRWRLA